MSTVSSYHLNDASTERAVPVNMMPLFHVGGIVRNLLAPMLSGGSVVMCAGFDPIAFWNLAAQLKVTWYVCASFPSPVVLVDCTQVLRCADYSSRYYSVVGRQHYLIEGDSYPYGMQRCRRISSLPCIQDARDLFWCCYPSFIRND